MTNTAYARLCTEYVGIVLLKAADTGKSRKSPRQLVPVQDAEVCHANRQLAVRTNSMAEHETVRGAIHGLHSELLVLHVEGEHVLPTQKKL